MNLARPGKWETLCLVTDAQGIRNNEVDEEPTVKARQASKQAGSCSLRNRAKENLDMASTLGLVGLINWLP